MSDADEAFERLRAVNPVTGAAPEHPDAATFVAAQHDPLTDVTRGRPGPPAPRGRNWALAAAAALVVVVGGLWLASRTESDRDVIDQVVIPTAVPTIEPGPSPPVVRPSPAPTAPPTDRGLDEATQALVDRFVQTYNAGDLEAFMALLRPDLQREYIVEADRRLLSQESIRALFAIDAALRTELSLECMAIQDLVSCVPTRIDDLHRILGVAPTTAVAWNFRFDEAGLVRGWNERRENVLDADPYEREVVAPFMRWVRENHPEIGELYGGVAAGWIQTKEAELIQMVDAFAASRTFDLPPRDP